MAAGRAAGSGDRALAAHTVHTVWNASAETTVIWTADLVEQDAPYVTYVGASGTPVP